MTRHKHTWTQFLLVSAGVILLAAAAFGQAPPAAQTPPPAKKPAAPSVPLIAPNGEVYIHAMHADKLGSLECALCHVAVKDGSVELQRPGHDQCTACHPDDFDNNYAKARPTLCAECHTSAKGSKTDLLPFPRYRDTRAILIQFSHALHKDQQVRKDPASGFRTDCTFCHKFDPQGVFAKFPGHTECAACHSKPGMKPQLTAALDTEGCVGCHSAQEIENPGFSKNRRMVAQTVVSGKYLDIKFTHTTHFTVRQKFNLDCTTCHYAIPKSTSLADQALPKMVDCVGCHETSKSIPAEYRMSNCAVCHSDSAKGSFIPVNHTVNVKPTTHTEGFRIHHEQESLAAGAACFTCHQNVAPARESNGQCMACHQVMKPVSHTSRWKDDIHGKYAALDRTTCATCHSADYCERCHNELPRSHTPLQLFAGGGHATLAQFDTRACLTCHTFQNTCSLCHTGGPNTTVPARR